MRLRYVYMSKVLYTGFLVWFFKILVLRLLV